MGLTRENKQTVIAEANTVMSHALSAVVADYRGLSAEEMTALRAGARRSQVQLQVIRNTLAKRAIEGTRFACLKEVLSGPTLLAFSGTDPGAPARLFKAFLKENEKLKIKGLSLGGQLLGAEALNTVSSLPTYKEAVTSLLWILKAPISSFVRISAASYTQLVRLLVAVGEKKKI